MKPCLGVYGSYCDFEDEIKHQEWESRKGNTDRSCRCALQVLEQWESQQGQSSPAQTSLSAPVIPHSAPFPTHHLHRASVPESASEALALAKPDPYDLYEKSRAIFESRRKYQRWYCRWSAVKTHSSLEIKQASFYEGRQRSEERSLFLSITELIHCHFCCSTEIWKSLLKFADLFLQSWRSVSELSTQ